MRKKILITGGAGFIGSYLTNSLSGDKNNFIFVLDDFSSGTDLLLKKSSNIKVYKSTIKKDILEKITKNVDLIVHLASIVGVDVTIKNFKRVIQNLKNTLILTNIAKKYNKPIIFSSSSDIYGLLGVYKEKDFKEDDYLIFESSSRWNYAHIKCLEEEAIKLSNLPFIIFRIFNTYGFGMDLKKPSRVFSNFLYSIIFQKPIVIYGDGNQKRSFCYVDDTVRGFILGINYLMKNKCKEILNIGNNQEICSVNNLKDKMIKIAKKLNILTKELEVRYLPVKERGVIFTDIEFRKPDLSKIKKMLSYEPKINLDKGIELSFKKAIKFKNKWLKLLKS